MTLALERFKNRNVAFLKLACVLLRAISIDRQTRKKKLNCRLIF